MSYLSAQNERLALATAMMLRDSDGPSKPIAVVLWLPTGSDAGLCAINFQRVGGTGDNPQVYVGIEDTATYLTLGEQPSLAQLAPLAPACDGVSVLLLVEFLTITMLGRTAAEYVA